MILVRRDDFAMSLRNFTFSKRKLLTGLMVLSVVLALLGPPAAMRLRGVAGTFLAPLGDAGIYVSAALENRIGEIAERGLSVEEHRKLRAELDELARVANYWKSQSEKHQRQAKAVKNFRGLYGQRTDLRCELIAARVVAVDALSYGRAAVVNVRKSRGSLAGALVTTRQIVTDRSGALPPGLAVVNASSLVGCLTDETQAFTARLRLVTDRDFRIRARIRRRVHATRPRKIRLLTEDAAEEVLTHANNAPVDCTARGDGVRGMLISGVPMLHSILPGDWVVSYPDEARSRIELIVGRVVKVTPQSETPRFVTVSVEPAADLSALRDVFVLAPIGLKGEGAR